MRSLVMKSLQSIAWMQYRLIENQGILSFTVTLVLLLSAVLFTSDSTHTLTQLFLIPNHCHTRQEKEITRKEQR